MVVIENSQERRRQTYFDLEASAAEVDKNITVKRYFDPPISLFLKGSIRPPYLARYHPERVFLGKWENLAEVVGTSQEELVLIVLHDRYTDIVREIAENVKKKGHRVRTAVN